MHPGSHMLPQPCCRLPSKRLARPCAPAMTPCQHCTAPKQSRSTRRLLLNLCRSNKLFLRHWHSATPQSHVQRLFVGWVRTHSSVQVANLMAFSNPACKNRLETRGTGHIQINRKDRLCPVNTRPNRKRRIQIIDCLVNALLCSLFNRNQ